VELECKLGHRFEVDPMFVSGFTKCQQEGCTEWVHAGGRPSVWTKGTVIFLLAFFVSLGMGVVGVLGIKKGSPLLTLGSGGIILPFVIAAYATQPAPDADDSGAKWRKLLVKMGLLALLLVGWGIALVVGELTH
jgi:hypothetical protein